MYPTELRGDLQCVQFPPRDAGTLNWGCSSSLTLNLKIDSKDYSNRKTTTFPLCSKDFPGLAQ